MYSFTKTTYYLDDDSLGPQTAESGFRSNNITQQLGTTSFHVYCQSFERYPDLRPHPLISPAHLNNERAKEDCSLYVMRMICLASLVSRYVTTKYPSLVRLDDYQKRNGPLKINDPHPVISYLRQSTSNIKNKQLSRNSQSHGYCVWEHILIEGMKIICLR